MPEHTHAHGGIQRGPSRADHFTVLSNAVLNDVRLSFRARGVLMWLLSKPADWRTRSDAIAAQSPTEGRDAIRTAMRELEELGYLVREKIQDDRGRWHTLHTIFEEPATPPAPGPGKPLPGTPDVGRPGPFTKNRSRRTETNHNPPRPRQCTGAAKSLLSEKAETIRAEDHRALADLESATLAAGLPASYGRVKPAARSEIAALIERHGIPTLVHAAKEAHRPDNPTVHVHGWMRLWQAIPAPRNTRIVVPPCGACVEGWIEDTDGLPVRRCECRTVVVQENRREGLLHVS